MEKRLNNKIEKWLFQFKETILEKAKKIGITPNDGANELLQYIYDYERLILTKEDFQKRKRVKNVVPIYNRCCALKAKNEQCSRRKKEGCEYCGTHVKGTPHGIVTDILNLQNITQKIQVCAQDIQGIIYYIDNNNNVYQAEDITCNKINPKIIAKYVKNGENYSIPEFNVNT
jgi:hypothetical protein